MLWDPWEKDFFSPHVDQQCLWRNLVCAAQKEVKSTFSVVMQHDLPSEPEWIWNAMQLPGWCQKEQIWPHPGLLCNKGGAAVPEMLISARCSTNETKLERVFVPVLGWYPSKENRKTMKKRTLNHGKVSELLGSWAAKWIIPDVKKFTYICI